MGHRKSLVVVTSTLMATLSTFGVRNQPISPAAGDCPTVRLGAVALTPKLRSVSATTVRTGSRSVGQHRLAAAVQARPPNDSGGRHLTFAVVRGGCLLYL